MDNKSFIDRIFFLYNVKKQEDLAEQLGISQNMISSWLNNKGTPRFAMLEKIVEETGCSWNWLITGEEDGKIDLTPEQKEAIRFCEELIDEGLKMVSMGKQGVIESIADPENAKGIIKQFLQKEDIAKLLNLKKKV